MDMSRRRMLSMGVGAAAGGGVAFAGATSKQTEPETVFKVHPVGRVEKDSASVRLRIFDRYAKALLGLDGFSHVYVIYWFDRNDTPQKRSILQVHPRGDRRNPLTGVFACRAPVRPNLIALSACRILSVAGAVVTVDAIDAFDRTPILDLKPFIPRIDAPTRDVRLPGWIGK